MRASSATDRGREALLPPTLPAESATDGSEAVRRRCGGATEADRALPPPLPPPLSLGSRPLSRPAASPRAELAPVPAAAAAGSGDGDGEADGEAAESKSGLVRVLA